MLRIGGPVGQVNKVELQMSIQQRSASRVEFAVLPFAACPAKTFQRCDGTTVAGRSVIEHCRIVGEVAKELVSRCLPALRQQLFPLGSELAAACHDIGKVSPCFVEKLRRACTDGIPGIAPLQSGDPAREKQWGGHAGVSQITAKALDTPQFVAEILGQHHGFSPTVAGLRADDDIFGGPQWQLERVRLVEELKAQLCSDWPCVASVAQARVLAGLASVSDWIGSGAYFEDPSNPWEGLIARALDAAGFVAPEYQPGLTFDQVFGFTPRTAQQQLIDAVTAPGVYVLEAPMGNGKTEAALFAAYRMLQAGQASGIYFALPTQLTSNKIYERFNQFLQGNGDMGLKGILSAECRHQSLLLHGKAWLLDTEMGEEGRPGGAWFNQSKRGLLAPFAVGTIDQALMATMNVKHGFVRAFGLAGKVVVLDEVHTYDAYTGTLLDALIELLRSLHCTVIVLSATLNLARRRQWLGPTLSDEAYPLISAAPHRQPIFEVPVPAERGNTVNIRLLEQESLAIDEALRRAALGQQVLWIENTVVDAQERYLDLAARAIDLGIDCGLLHSRYTAADRQNIETRWVNLFGKAGWPLRGVQGRILVGTQVLEQSLDIDADFMVSRFAPTDMLLQRLGRLWRHGKTPRSSSSVCEAWVLAPELESAISAPIAGFGRSAHVYSPYVLCRSLEVWRDLHILLLPQAIRPLIEQTYAQRSEEGAMAMWLRQLDEGTPRRIGRIALAQLARVPLAQDGRTLPESKAQTRYSETDCHELLLLRSLQRCPADKSCRLTLLNGELVRLPWHRSAHDDKAQWRQLTAQLMRQLVPVHVRDAPLPLPVDTLKRFGFQHCFYLGREDWEGDESLFRIALVDATGRLLGVDGAQVHERHQLDYRDDLGFRVIKN